MPMIRTMLLGGAAIASLAAIAAATPARADDRDHWRHDDHHGWYHRGPAVGVFVGAPPVYYAPPPVYYAPPPVYYAPPPVVYAPPIIGLGIGVHIR